MTARKPVSHCPMCNTRLDDLNDQMMGVCKNAFCRGPYFHRHKLEMEAVRKSSRKAIVERTLETHREQIDLYNAQGGGDRRLPQIALNVPSLDRSILPLPEARRQQFIDNMKRLSHEAEASMNDPSKVERIEVEFSVRGNGQIAPAPLAVINGCSTCRGFCCREGGTDAFITADFIAWQLIHDSDLTSESLLEQYLNLLPSESVEDSCVFHTSQGCQLPRNMRNNICNDFHCAGLMDVANSFQITDSILSVAISTDNEEVKRIGIMSSKTTRHEIEVSMPSPSHD